VDNATWQALGLTLTLLGLVASLLLWRRRGPASGLRAAAWALLPLAAAMTGTLRLGWEIAESIVDWAVRLVFSPVVWLGIVLAGISVVLFVVSGVVRRRTAPEGRKAETPGRKAALPKDRSTPGAPAVGDDDMADIEAILRRHGIS
jgi:heme exporter protein D